MTANVSQLSSLPEGGEAAHALSHAYIFATPEMPFIPSYKRSGFVKGNLAGGGRGERSSCSSWSGSHQHLLTSPALKLPGSGKGQTSVVRSCAIACTVWVHFGVCLSQRFPDLCRSQILVIFQTLLLLFPLLPPPAPHLVNGLILN